MANLALVTPGKISGRYNSHLLAVRINADGQVVQVMKGSKSVRPTEVMEREGSKLYMGSVELPYVGVVSE